ncbi:transposable element Tc1 transposase [Trichonephila clavipes]|nr:transposable element Tc1 transposase [Trichonephila clavipes]
MPLRRWKSYYQQLTEFERGRVIRLREDGFYFPPMLHKNLAGIYPLGMIVGSRDQGMELSQEDRIQGGLVALLCWKTTLFRVRLWHCVLRQKFECHARAYWRTMGISVVFSNESSMYLGASDGCMLVRRRQGERRLRHTGSTPEVMVSGAISCGSRGTLRVILSTPMANLCASLEEKRLTNSNLVKFIVNFLNIVYPQTNPHSEEFGTVIEDDDDTNIYSEKELSLEQELKICNVKKPNISKENHVCSNFEGSSGSMEPVGVCRMFECSKHLRKLQCFEYYGDGNSKAFKAVKNIYGKDSVTKLECTGHVQKRVGGRLRKFEK